MARKRMIDPGIWDSEQVQRLSLGQFKLYLYLISQADDDGRVKVSIPLFKSRVHPIEEYDYQRFVSDMTVICQCGLVTPYFDDNGVYIFHPNWERYQKIDRKFKSRIPDHKSCQLMEISDYRLLVSDMTVTSKRHISPNGIEYNISEKKNDEYIICTEPEVSDSAPKECEAEKPQAPKILKIQFDKEARAWDGISDSQVAEWSAVYPALDIERELGKAKEWVLANPTKIKKNWRRFLVNWFSRAQERGGERKQR